MSVEFQPAIPVFCIFDEAKAREFYLGWLGMTMDWEHRFKRRHTDLLPGVERTGEISLVGAFGRSVTRGHGAGLYAWRGGVAQRTDE